ncbi:MAG: hypothetical protein MJ239_05755 [Bacilli bacterium]|nr:hypothetical protein [Bacilli bacterium]
MAINKVYSIADKTFRVSSIYEDIHILSRSYASKGKPEFTIEVEQKDIDKEKEIAIASKEYHNEPDSYLETLVVLRKLMNVISGEGYILFHGSLIEIYNRGYLFTAKSGVGKTTHTRLYKKWLGKRLTIVNGDKPILKFEEDGVYAYGTPWCGKEGLNTPKKVKLHAICWLNRGEENKISPISPEEGFETLFTQTHRDAKNMAKTFSLVGELSRKVPLYKLECNMEEDAPRVSYEGMNPKKSFEDIILLDGALVYTARGVSMYPLILEKKDVLTITKNENDPKVGDVVLFKRDNGTYVLHRCVAIKKDGFVMCGDNQYHKEKGVLPRQILGVLSSITRDGKTFLLDGDEMKKHTEKVLRTYPSRAIKLWLKSIPTRLRRKITSK